MCVCERESILGYMADIRPYPSFHQLSEEESNSNTVQSDAVAHTHTHMHILRHTVAENQTYFNPDCVLLNPNLTAAFHWPAPSQCMPLTALTSIISSSQKLL